MYINDAFIELTCAYTGRLPVLIFAEKSSTIAQRSQAEMHLYNPLSEVLLQKNQLELLYLNPSITKRCSLTAERPRMCCILVYFTSLLMRLQILSVICCVHMQFCPHASRSYFLSLILCATNSNKSL